MRDARENHAGTTHSDLRALLSRRGKRAAVAWAGGAPPDAQGVCCPALPGRACGAAGDQRRTAEVVWSQTHVSEAALAVCIREIRQAVGDHTRTPRCIETVHGRGYRFMAPVTVADRLPAAPPPLVPPASPPLLVGREVESAQMQRWWAKAVQGERQVAFVTGEAGIGKTTLVAAFIARVAGDGALGIGHGQCIEQYGAGD